MRGRKVFLGGQPHPVSRRRVPASRKCCGTGTIRRGSRLG